MRLLVTLAMFVFCTAIARAETQAECVNGMLYLSNSRSSALFVEPVTGQAVYSRQIDNPEELLDVMRKSIQQRNVMNCASTLDHGSKCVDIGLLEGRIILAFRQGSAGFKYEVRGVKFEIAEVVRNLGFGLGDMYWIRYQGQDKNNPAGIFTYSSTQGVLSISMSPTQTLSAAPVGSTLTLVQRPGLLAHESCPK